MPTKLDLRISENANNLASIAPDGGLQVEDPSLRCAGADGQLVWFTWPNRMTSQTTPVWWRNTTGATGTTLSSNAAGKMLLQPLVVTRDCLLVDLAARIDGYSTAGNIQWALYTYTGPFGRWDRYGAAVTMQPITTNAVVTLSTPWNTPLVAGRLYLLAYSPQQNDTYVAGKYLVGNPFGESVEPTSLSSVLHSAVMLDGRPDVTATIDMNAIPSPSIRQIAPLIMLKLQNT